MISPDVIDAIWAASAGRGLTTFDQAYDHVAARRPAGDMPDRLELWAAFSAKFPAHLITPPAPSPINGDALAFGEADRSPSLGAILLSMAIPAVAIGICLWAFA